MPITTILEDWVLSQQKNAVQVYILHHVFELAQLNLDFIKLPKWIKHQ